MSQEVDVSPSESEGKVPADASQEPPSEREVVSVAPPAPPYFNRELSWLAFNERVLEEAEDHANPLLERLRFITIFHTNLDEFFMIRVSGLVQQVAANIEMRSPDGLTPRAQLHHISDRLETVMLRAQRCLHDDILPALADEGLPVHHYADLSQEDRERQNAWYDRHVHPVLTPLAVGPTHPFPFISSLSLNLAATVRSKKGEERLARVKVPAMLPRLVPIGPHTEAGGAFVPLEELIAANLPSLFPGMEVDPPWVFRVTRDADVEIREDEANDLLKTVEEGLRRRRFGGAVRLEVQAGCPAHVRDALKRGLHLDDTAVYEVQGLLAVSRLSPMIDVDRPDLKHEAFVPRLPKGLTGGDLFADIDAGDILLHHPYESFSPVIDFVQAAARDPSVLAIKQTLYRTSGDSLVIGALEEAVESGKQVAVVVELKARFDEHNNIGWARHLEEAGVHVVYGVTGLKTHSKIALVIRDTGDGLRRYVHIGTGNYNRHTARVYTDFGLMTSDKQITQDVADIFNRITGFARPPRYRKLLVAPHHMRKGLLKRIRRETRYALAGETAHLIFKCNALTDVQMIDALYDASRAGVRVDLLIRGICCLVPGVAGQSENIVVRSVVGRFLEHSRCYWFANKGAPEVYLGSADLMGRNLDRRVEVLTPVTDPSLSRWLRETYLRRFLDDDGRTRVLSADGVYRRLQPAGKVHDVQGAFLADKKR